MNSESPIGKLNGNGAGPAPEFLTLKQASQRLQLSEASLRRAYHRGELKAFLLGAALRIRRVDLDGWVEAQRWTPTLCAEKTARPRAGRRKPKMPAGRPDEPAAEAAPGPEATE